MAFSATERFTLYDQDGAFLPSPMDELEIPEPTGFDSFEFSVVRGNATENSSDPTKYFGFSNEFGEENSELGFDWNKSPGQTYSARQMLESILTNIGVDANVSLRYYRTVSGVESLKYEWYLIFDDAEEIDGKIFFPVQRQDFGDKLRTRFDTTINLESAVDLDNNANNPIDLITLPLHPRGVILEYDADYLTKETIGDTVFSEDFIILRGDTGSGDYMNIGWRNIVTDEIGITGVEDSVWSVEGDLAPFFIAPYRGKYTINSKLTSQNGAFVGSGAFSNPDNVVLRVVSKGVESDTNFTKSTDVTVITVATYTFTGELELLANDEVYLFWNGTSGLPFYQAPIELDVDGTLVRRDFITISALTFAPASTVEGAFIYEVLNKCIEKAVGQDAQLIVSNTLTFLKFTNSDSIEGSLSGATGDVVTVDSTGMLLLIESTSGQFQNGENIFSGNTIWNIEQIQFAVIVLDSPISVSIGDEIGGNTSGTSGLVSITEGVITNIIVTSLDGSFVIGEQILLNNVLQAEVINSFKIRIICRNFSVGDTVTGTVSGTTGQVSLESDSVISVDVNDDSFNVGEQVSGTNNAIAYTVSVDIVEDSNIINSDFISKKEQGATSDGYGSLNFITTGKKIRNIEGAVLETSNQKIFEHLRVRYCFGWNIYDDAGSTRIRGGQSWLFFNPVKIATLTNVENPVRRLISNDYLFNEIELGYGKYAKENEESSASGFNTIKNYSLPIQKVKRKLSIISPCTTDGAELERLRRLKKDDESDQSDDETFIIKCQRFNSSNRISSVYAQEDWSVLMTDDTTITLNGYYLKGQIDDAQTITIAVGALFLGTFQTFTINAVEYDSEVSTTRIFVDETLPFSPAEFSIFSFFFNKDIFLPERIENVSGFIGFDDPRTEYNIDHAPSNILIQWWHWLGSALTQKPTSSVIKFLSGKNNTSVGKSYIDSDGPYTNSLIYENQDFTISALSSYNTQQMLPFEWELTCYISFDTFDEIRSCLLGISENSPDNNFGYLEFSDNFGNLVNIYVKSIKRVEKTGKTSIIGWEVDGSTPPPPPTHYLLREDDSYYLREDGSIFIREH